MKGKPIKEDKEMPYQAYKLSQPEKTQLFYFVEVLSKIILEFVRKFSCCFFSFSKLRAHLDEGFAWEFVEGKENGG